MENICGFIKYLLNFLYGKLFARNICGLKKIFLTISITNLVSNYSNNFFK